MRRSIGIVIIVLNLIIFRPLFARFPNLKFFAQIEYSNMLSQKNPISRLSGHKYRQFSRKRYAELKAQSSRMRESEIVARVMRQWEEMNLLDSIKMKEEAMVPLNIESLATPQKEKMNKANQKTTVEKKTQKMEMKEESSLSLDDINVKQFDESSSKQMKSKAISKNRSEYVSFFKHYFKKLHAEHTRWNCRQITTIVKLLWRKKKASQKSVKMRPIKLAKPISGRKAFMKSSNLPAQEKRKRWGRLPRETRMKWTQIGNPSLGQKTMSMNKKTTMMLSSKMSLNSMPALDFLQMRMM